MLLSCHKDQYMQIRDPYFLINIEDHHAIFQQRIQLIDFTFDHLKRLFISIPKERLQQFNFWSLTLQNTKELLSDDISQLDLKFREITCHSIQQAAQLRNTIKNTSKLTLIIDNTQKFESTGLQKGAPAKELMNPVNWAKIEKRKIVENEDENTDFEPMEVGTLVIQLKCNKGIQRILNKVRPKPKGKMIAIFEMDELANIIAVIKSIKIYELKQSPLYISLNS
ncbi:hypothetical protein FGO68_gene3619 [Halteria grandinella]|uniref:Uncharacterized protein n=1 Tax=Halteria grandinella TaxID=5974 RepID=A0A8J8NY02_HALGN|nr:hypothetical protein FGO68_gene3619 [Halteria grandinella]